MKLHVAHILLQQKYEAEDVQRKLKEGVDFAQLAQKYSQCPSGQQGGDLGEVPVSRLDATFAEAAETLKPGEVSAIVRTRFGHHIIKRLK